MTMQGSNLNSITFNQDASCFACGTNRGFRLYNCDPYKETLSREFDNGGIGMVEMLFKCNILALVGGGPIPKFAPSKVMIWDDMSGKCIGELTFRSQVKSVRLRRDRVVVALEHKVLLYNFADLKPMHQIETLPNPQGLVALSSAHDNTVLACPGLHKGQVRVELYDRKQTRFISAHNQGLACLALSLDGKRLATASEKGTLIRVWNTSDSTLLQELRRGSDPACIHSIALSKGCEWLAVSSDKGTVHVFSLAEEVQAGVSTVNSRQGSSSAIPAPMATPSQQQALPAAPSANGVERAGSSGSQVEGASGVCNSQQADRRRSNPTSLVKGLVPSLALPKYFRDSEWSFAQFKVPGIENGCRSVIGFGSQPNILFVITSGGSFYKLTFDVVKGGSCVQDTYMRFIDPMASDLAL